MLAAIGNEIEPKTGKPFFQVAAEALVGEVFRGDVQAFKEFADRVDGRSTQTVELSGGLHVQQHDTEWGARFAQATGEERERMKTELDDKILACAELIKASRADTPQNRYRDRLREYHERIAAGESHEVIQADFAMRPLVLEPGPIN
jgi:hypothetical protein